MTNDFIKNIFGMYVKEFSDGINVEREVGILTPRTEQYFEDECNLLEDEDEFPEDIEDNSWGSDSYWTDQYEVHKPKVIYTEKIFVPYILGRGDYRPFISIWTSEDMKEAVRDKLNDIIPNSYFIVREEGKQIALAAPMYIPNAKITVAKALGIVPETFIEVSGPGSTVLIIDCEKEFLKKEYFNIGENEWLL